MAAPDSRVACSGREEGQRVTHEVTNQPPPLAGSNAWRGDPLLIQIAENFSAPVRKDLDTLGRFVMTPEAQELARLANTETPVLKTHDRQGRRIDVVEFHPAYHALMRRSMANGLHSSVWENGEAETGRRHQVRAARIWWRRPISGSPFSHTDECRPFVTERRISA